MDSAPSERADIAIAAAAPIRVAFDASVLGLAEGDPLARTGVHRVVQNVAYGLHEAVECEVRFCAPLSHHALFQTRAAVRADPRIRDVPVVAPGRSLRVEPVHAVAERLPLGNGRAARVLGRVFDAVGRPLPRDLLEWAEVYHSPFHPLPMRTARTPLARFLMVHDLIPLLFPHLFPPGGAANHERLLGSIGPDDFVFCNSYATRSDLCEYHPIDPERVYVHHLAASADTFFPCDDTERRAEVRRKYGIPDAPYLLSVNTLEPRKNVEHLIRSFAHLVEQERLHDLRLVLVGAHGWDRGQIEQAVRDTGALRSRIVRTGFVDDADMAPLYSGALAFVYVSLYEGFGLPPLEAMQCGTPVITSNTSSLPEVVGDAGLMLGPTDSDALGAAMLSVCSDPELRRDLSARALQRARRFTWDRCLSQILKAYRTSLQF